MAGKAADNKRIVTQLKKLVKNLPIEVLGHVDAPALCCRSGTVALVKIDTVSNPDPTAKSAK
jgi:hypothetical protein